MAVQSQQQPSPASIPTAQVVGNAFVHQYYHILHQSPELVYRFYNENSKLGRPEADGLMSSVTTMQAINEKILSLGYGDFTAEIKTVDAQDSLNGGVLVLVTGYLTRSDNVRRNFTQSFFLAPQDKGYFVLNDIFRYMEDDEYAKDNQVLPNETVALMEPQQDTAPVEVHTVSEQTAISSEEDVTVEEVYSPSENGDSSVAEEVPTVNVVTDAQSNGQMVADTSSVVVEEVPKKSYASIVKVMKENPAPVAVSIPASSPAKPSPAKVERQLAPAPVPDTVQNPESPSSNVNGTEDGNAQETEADGHSIYIRGLPMNATPAQLEPKLPNGYRQPGGERGPRPNLEEEEGLRREDEISAQHHQLTFNLLLLRLRLLAVWFVPEMRVLPPSLMALILLLFSSSFVWTVHCQSQIQRLSSSSSLEEETARRSLLSFRETRGNASFECSPSGPCVACQYSEKNDEKYRCSETGYRIPLKCVESRDGSKVVNSKSLRKRSVLEHDTRSNAHIHPQLHTAVRHLKWRRLLDIKFTMEDNKRTYITYRSCVPPVSEEKLTVIGFEAIMLGLLLLSAPLVYYRRRGTVSMSGVGAQRIPTNSRF